MAAADELGGSRCPRHRCRRHEDRRRNRRTRQRCDHSERHDCDQGDERRRCRAGGNRGPGQAADRGRPAPDRPHRSRRAATGGQGGAHPQRIQFRLDRSARARTPVQAGACDDRVRRSRGRPGGSPLRRRQGAPDIRLRQHRHRSELLPGDRRPPACRRQRFRHSFRLERSARALYGLRSPQCAGRRGNRVGPGDRRCLRPADRTRRRERRGPGGREWRGRHRHRHPEFCSGPARVLGRSHREHARSRGARAGWRPRPCRRPLSRPADRLHARPHLGRCLP